MFSFQSLILVDFLISKDEINIEDRVLRERERETMNLTIFEI